MSESRESTPDVMKLLLERKADANNPARARVCVYVCVCVCLTVTRLVPSECTAAPSQSVTGTVPYYSVSHWNGEPGSEALWLLCHGPGARSASAGIQA